MKFIAVTLASIAAILIGFFALTSGKNEALRPLQEEASVANGSKNPGSPSTNSSSAKKDKANSFSDKLKVDYDEVLSDTDPSLITDVEFDAILERKPYRQYRVVKVDTNVLRDKIRNAEFRETFTVTLFDEPITLITERGREYSEGWQAGLATWEGKISDREWSYCAIVIDPNGLVRATFQAEDIGFVTIEALGESGHHLMWSMDDSKIVDKGNDTSFIDRGDDDT